MEQHAGVVQRQAAGDDTWLVVRSKAQRERVAMTHLAGRGAEVYCPMFLRRPSHPRAPRRPMPLFPGYLFARDDGGISLNGMSYCPGVSTILHFNGCLARVEHSLIEALRAQENSSGYILPWEQRKDIRAGSTVTITEGPLKGIEGVFKTYLNGLERARVLVNFLQRSTLVEVDTMHLRVVS